MSALIRASTQDAGYAVPAGPSAKVTLRAEAEPGESEPTYRKAIARDIVPLGVRLQRCLARLHARRRWRGRLLRDGGRGCAESENDEKARRDTERAN